MYTEEQEQDTPESSSEFTEDYLERQIQNNYDAIQYRKLLANFFLWFITQCSSYFLCWMLFNFGVNILVISLCTLSCSIVASLDDISQFNINKNEEGWSLNIMNNPIVTIIKLGGSFLVTCSTVFYVNGLLKETHQSLAYVYQQSRDFYKIPDNSMMSLPEIMVFIGAMAITGFIIFVSRR